MPSDAAELTAVVLLYRGCIVAEVAEVASRISRSGARVLWAGLDTDSFVDDSGLHIKPATTIDALLADGRKIDALIIPGGGPDAILGNELVQRFVAHVAETGIVAGICAGVLVVADAGCLVERNATHNYRPPWTSPEVQDHVAALFADAIIEPDRSVGVVVDANIITALPNAAAEFSLTICQHLGIYNEPEAQLLTRHLQGEFVTELFD